MAEAIHWTCPYCDRDSTLREGDYSDDSHQLDIQNVEGAHILSSHFTVCPNQKCNKFTLEVSLRAGSYEPLTRRWIRAGEPRRWSLVPPSKAKAFPSYVPGPIIADYNEACLIADLSPKASATLSRRCLQGILRDFWKVKPGQLVNEIDQIKDKTDHDTWEAIEAVRKIGNIGAHMEKDINLIVDVEPNEAKLLIELIETLIRDWYIAREDRKSRLAAIKQIAEAKDRPG